jgi:hypothetical protein
MSITTLKSPIPVPIASQIIPIHSLQTYSPKSHYDIIILRTSRSSEWFTNFRVLNQNFMLISHFPKCLTSHAHLYVPNNIWWTLQCGARCANLAPSYHLLYLDMLCLRSEDAFVMTCVANLMEVKALYVQQDLRYDISSYWRFNV